MSQFITYAQNYEDVILDAFFSDVDAGFYIDVGANHPINDSVTKHFYLKGWRGIDIEPIKSLYTLLRKDRPRDIVLNCGISDKKGELSLRQYDNTGLSTFSDELKNEYAHLSQIKTDTHEDIVVPIVTLADIFKEHKVDHVHFMKIDVEGLEFNVIAGNDWSKYRPEMLCIESNHIAKDKDWRDVLKKHDYSLVYNDGLNDYYLAKESAYRKTKFSYVDTFLLSDQILPFHVRDKIVELQTEIRDKDIKLELQKIHATQLGKDKENLEHQIKEQQRLKSTAKLFAKALDKFIQAYIEKLRRVKQPTAIPNVKDIPGTQYDQSSREALITSIHQADMATYYTTKPPKGPQKFYVYHAVNGTYKAVRRIPALPYRLLKNRKKESVHVKG